MKWNNTQQDGIPEDGQQVLISVRGINYMAIFIKDRSMFVISSPGTDEFDSRENGIYWVPIPHSNPSAGY
jgi:hypothetical protein